MPPISSVAQSSSPPLFAIIRNQDSVQLQTKTVSCITGGKSAVPKKQRGIRTTWQFLIADTIAGKKTCVSKRPFLVAVIENIWTLEGVTIGW